MALPQPSDSFVWTQEPWGFALQCRPLLTVSRHLFTSAPLTVSRGPDDPELAAVASSLDLSAAAMAQVDQVHGRDVAWLPRMNPTSRIHSWAPRAADALLTDDPDLAVAVRVADCVPLLMADRRGRAAAAVHAGWRGTAARVAVAAVEAFRERSGVEPRDLLVALGPSIRACCYEVGPELKDAFAASRHDPESIQRWFSKGRADRWQLDVLRANRDQLEGAGVPSQQIFDAGLCTACHPDVFHSYRRGGTRAGRALAAIRLETAREP